MRAAPGIGREPRTGRYDMSPKDKPVKPIDVYVRVSRVGNRDVTAEGGTATEQERRCRAYLEAKDLQAGEVFTDLEETGGKLTRPQFDQAIERAKSGVSGGLICINLRRFGRTSGAADLVIELEQAGAADHRPRSELRHFDANGAGDAQGGRGLRGAGA